MTKPKRLQKMILPKEPNIELRKLSTHDDSLWTFGDTEFSMIYNDSLKMYFIYDTNVRFSIQFSKDMNPDMNERLKMVEYLFSVWYKGYMIGENHDQTGIGKTEI